MPVMKADSHFHHYIVCWRVSASCHTVSGSQYSLPVIFSSAVISLHAFFCLKPFLSRHGYQKSLSSHTLPFFSLFTPAGAGTAVSCILFFQVRCDVYMVLIRRRCTLHVLLPHTAFPSSVLSWIPYPVQWQQDISMLLPKISMATTKFLLANDAKRIYYHLFPEGVAGESGGN